MLNEEIEQKSKALMRELDSVMKGAIALIEEINMHLPTDEGLNVHEKCVSLMNEIHKIQVLMFHYRIIP